MSKIKRAKFMINHKTKHPALVFDDLGKQYGFVGITHAPKTFKRKNIILKENPEFGEKSKSYILPYPMKDHKNHFGKSKKKLKIGAKNRYWFNKVRNKPYIK